MLRTTPSSSFPAPQHAPPFQTGEQALSSTVNFVAAERYSTSKTSNTVLSGHLERRASSQELNLTIVGGWYCIDMSIGTPRQKFQAIVVTDSNQAWVNTFDSSRSSTAANISLGSTTLLSGFGSVTGYLFDDTISLGSYSVPQGQFLNANGGPSGLPFDITGFLGLAPTGFWGVNLASGQVAAPEMGLWLSSSQDPDSGGSLTFGGVNPSLYSGDIEFLPLTGAQGTSAWMLNVSAVSVGGKSIPVPVGSSLAAFSTGLYHIAGPSAVLKTIWAAVPGSILNTSSGVYHFPCSPPVEITVSFGGKAWPLDAAEIIMPVASGSVECQGAIGASGSDDWTFGHGFLKYVYTVFRAVPPSVGFAELSTLAGGTGMPNSTGGSNTGSPTPTGSSTTSSGGPTQSSAVPPHPKPKTHTGAIVSGVIGGLAMFMLVAVFVFYRSRRRSKQRTASSPDAPITTPHPLLSFVIDEQDQVTQTNTIPGPSLPPTTPVVRSPFITKREQIAAPSRYGDIHTAPHGISQTSQTSSESLPTDRGSEITPSVPVAGIGAPAVLEEMHSLLTEMRRLATEQERPYAPPSYS
ncbi:aspartic peptidase domain-containing protein [Mycena rebaudengoi]|nr:aspartic peptidase domain-containing protein [Mycena rebaudengoi]